jgi:response regulator RpfG family c-di-GMP phosphodiesterase
MTTVPLRLLLVEDSPDDATFLVRELRKSGYDVQWRRVEARADLVAALGAETWDLVVSDFIIPGFGGLEALDVVHDQGLDLPFLMVSGKMDEETAVEAMRAGAHDYIVKGHWSRLGPAVHRELREARGRKARREAEQAQARHWRRLAALRAIDLAIMASSDLRVTLDVVLEKVQTELAVDAACVLKLNPSAQKLEVVTRRGFTTGALRHTHLRLGVGHAGQAALDRRTVLVSDLRASTGGFHQSPHLEAEGFVGYVATPLVARGGVCGVLEVFSKHPLEPDEEWQDFLETLAGQAAIAIDSATMFLELQHSHLELSLAYEATIEGWARALELRDLETKGHTRRVTEMSVRLGTALGLEGAPLQHLRRGATLHDVGKMAIPDGILLKPGRLSDDELAIMRRHAAMAYDMLQEIPFLRPAAEVPYAHHERWDGKGYPRGLKGLEIPLAARIFAVVDVWDALRSARPYKEPWPDERVREHLRQGAGGHFDPEVVSAFLQLDWETEE